MSMGKSRGCLYTAWYILVVGNTGTMEDTKGFSLPEKQLMDTCSLLLLATYSLFSLPNLIALANQ